MQFILSESRARLKRELFATVKQKRQKFKATSKSIKEKKLTRRKRVEYGNDINDVELLEHNKDEKKDLSNFSKGSASKKEQDKDEEVEANYGSETRNHAEVAT